MGPVWTEKSGLVDRGSQNIAACDIWEVGGEHRGDWMQTWRRIIGNYGEMQQLLACALPCRMDTCACTLSLSTGARCSWWSVHRESAKRSRMPVSGPSCLDQFLGCVSRMKDSSQRGLCPSAPVVQMLVIKLGKEGLATRNLDMLGLSLGICKWIVQCFPLSSIWAPVFGRNVFFLFLYDSQ